MRASFATMVCFIFLATGCGAKSTAPVTSSPSAPAAAPAPSRTANAAAAVQAAQQSVNAAAPAPATTGTAEATAPSNPNTEQVVAKSGVGIKGRSLDEHEGLLVTPVKALFSAKERAVFEIQVPAALQLYKASDPRGEAPKTQAEFMSGVIEANMIKLPQLPAGHKYVYVPKTEQLMVERPRSVAP